MILFSDFTSYLLTVCEDGTTPDTVTSSTDPRFPVTDNTDPNENGNTPTDGTEDPTSTVEAFDEDPEDNIPATNDPAQPYEVTITSPTDEDTEPMEVTLTDLENVDRIVITTPEGDTEVQVNS